MLSVSVLVIMVSMLSCLQLGQNWCRRHLSEKRVGLILNVTLTRSDLPLRPSQSIGHPRTLDGTMRDRQEYKLNYDRNTKRLSKLKPNDVVPTP